MYMYNVLQIVSHIHVCLNHMAQLSSILLHKSLQFFSYALVCLLHSHSAVKTSIAERGTVKCTETLEEKPVAALNCVFMCMMRILWVHVFEDTDRDQGSYWCKQ